MPTEPYALCPMPHALCPVVPHLSEKGYNCLFLFWMHRLRRCRTHLIDSSN
ncbi:MAG: hypothetical protein WBL95_04160 [Microcoleus sp.]